MVPGVRARAGARVADRWQVLGVRLPGLAGGEQLTHDVVIGDRSREAIVGGDAYQWGQLMAAAVLGSVPIALGYSFFLRYYVAGMTAGAVKG